MLNFKNLQAYINNKYKLNEHREIVLVELAKFADKQSLLTLLDFVSQQPVPIALISLDDTLLSNTFGSETSLINTKSYRSYLGNEYAHMVFDARADIDLNALYACAGMLQKRGILFLCIGSSNDENTDDNTIAPSIKYSYGQNSSPSIFKPFFLKKLQQQGFSEIHTLNVDVHENNGPFELIPSNNKRSQNKSVLLSEQQQSILSEIIDSVNRQNGEPKHHIILGKRGRGKSTLMAYLAHALYNHFHLGEDTVHAKQSPIVISAAHRSQTNTIFSTLALLSTDERQTKHLQRAVNFIPIDALIRNPIPGALVLVDELASISPTLIKRILAIYPQVILTGTTSGYEGSGKGFVNRLLPYIKSNYSYSVFTLDSSFRWYKNDPIEDFFEQHIFAEEPEQLAQPSAKHTFNTHKHFSLADCKTRLVEKQELLSNDSLYRQIVSLMAEAHYQTSPNDIVRLFDECLSKIIVIEKVNKTKELAIKNNANQPSTQVLGVCLILEEGGSMLSKLAIDISLGARRVQGHLSAQALSSYCLSPHLCKLKYWRVNRIAVKDEYRKQGLARLLLDACEKLARNYNVDALTSSFGYTKALYDFWDKNDFALVKIGPRIDTSSGSASIVVFKTLNEYLQGSVNLLQHRVIIDLNYFIKLDPLLKNIYLDLDIRLKNIAKNVCFKNRREDSELFLIFLRKFKKELIAFKHFAPILFNYCEQIQPKQKRNLVLNFFVKWYAGGLHLHEKTLLENEILSAIDLKDDLN